MILGSWGYEGPVPGDAEAQIAGRRRVFGVERWRVFVEAQLQWTDGTWTYGDDYYAVGVCWQFLFQFRTVYHDGSYHKVLDFGPFYFSWLGYW